MTVRDSSWRFERENNRRKKAIEDLFGSLTFDAEKFRARFFELIQVATETFKDCQERFLVLDLYEDYEKHAKKIMDFLNIHKDIRFPHEHRQSYGHFQLW